MATILTITPEAEEPNSNYQVFNFNGELDKSNIQVVSDAIKDVMVNNTQNIIFDFTELKFINSEGIGYLVSLHYKISKLNKKLILVGIQPNIQDILNLIGIPTIIPCFNTAEDAAVNIANQ